MSLDPDLIATPFVSMSSEKERKLLDTFSDEFLQTINYNLEKTRVKHYYEYNYRDVYVLRTPVDSMINIASILKKANIVDPSVLDVFLDLSEKPMSNNRFLGAIAQTDSDIPDITKSLYYQMFLNKDETLMGLPFTNFPDKPMHENSLRDMCKQLVVDLPAFDKQTTDKYGLSKFTENLEQRIVRVAFPKFNYQNEEGTWTYQEIFDQNIALIKEAYAIDPSFTVGWINKISHNIFSSLLLDLLPEMARSEHKKSLSWILSDYLKEDDKLSVDVYFRLRHAANHQGKLNEVAINCGAYRNILQTDIRLVDYIGGGAHADVFLAENTSTDTFSAVKIDRRGMQVAGLGEITPHLEGEQGQKNEAVTMDKLIRNDISVIPKIYHYGKHWVEGMNEKYGIEMEYVQGHTINELFNQGLNDKQWLTIISQLVKGTNDCNLIGVYHHDIRPDNVKVTPDGIVKILDFGVSSDDEKQPEQYNTRHGDSDIQSVGIMYTTALLGYPFGNKAEYNNTLTFKEAVKQAKPQFIQDGIVTDDFVNTLYGVDTQYDKEKIVNLLISMYENRPFEELRSQIIDIDPDMQPLLIDKKDLTARLWG